MINDINYAGKSFRQDLGLYVDTIESYGTPKKSYTFHEVLGRNGSLAVDDKRFEDHEETFNCYIRKDFLPNFRAVQAFFNSLKGYQRLERSNEPDYFEMGLYEGEISPRPTQLLQTGAFPFRLRLHPEKWLKSGETAVDAASTSETLEGNPIQFENPSGLTALTGLTAEITPVQDLNGYSQPWVGGAGDNVLNASGLLSASFTSNGDGTYTFTKVSQSGVTNRGTALAPVNLKAGKTYTLSWVSSETNFETNVATPRYRITGTSNYEVADTKPAVASNGLKKSTITLEHDCDAVQIYLNNDSYNIGASFKVSEIQINEGSDVLPWTPYENICPITGHTSASVTRTGKNLLDTFGRTFSASSETANTIRTEGSTASFQGDSIVTVTNGVWSKLRFKMEGLVKGKTYTLSAYFVNPSKNITGIGISLDGGITWSINVGRYDGVVVQKSFNYDETSTSLILAVITNNTGSATGATVIASNIQLEMGATATEYEPFVGNTYTVNLNDTRYGGTLNVLTGVLAVDMVSVDMGSLTWRYESNTNCMVSSPLSGARLPSSDSVAVNAITSVAKVIPASQRVQVSGIRAYMFTGNREMLFRDTGYTDASTWKTAVTGQTICYELTTPTTVQLTAQQVSLLTGTNIISTDMESLTVTVSNPSELENPTLFESKPLIRIYGTGTVNINNDYITIDSASPFAFIDLDCETMNASSAGNNANQYIEILNDAEITLKPGTNYVAYSGSITKVEITPRWYTI